MNKDQLMTWGAVAFAGFALYYITRKKQPGTEVSAQPAQRDRDTGLMDWLSLLNQQKSDTQPAATAAAAADAYYDNW